MEPFLENDKLYAPIDMEVGPDGRLYILEYGKGWFAKNKDAGLARIDYLAGNRPPKIASIKTNKLNGNLPFTVTATVKATDPENDKLTYIWTVGGIKKTTTVPTLTHTITKAGDYKISVQVLDVAKASAKSSVVEIYAGNEQPLVNIDVKGNKSFFFPNQPVNYTVNVVDKGAKVDMKNLYVSTDYVQGRDMAGASMGHQVISDAMIGKNLMLASDCKACHSITEKSIGPAYTEVAKKYQKDTRALGYLASKIIKGGGGVWGENVMPAHLTMPESDARQIATFILSLANAESTKPTLPAAGTIQPVISEQRRQNNVFRLLATYTDNGGTGISPLAGSGAVYLRSSAVDVADFQATDINGFAPKDSSGSKYLVLTPNRAWMKGQKLDLTGVKSIDVEGFSANRAGKYYVEARLGSPTGTKLGETTLTFNTDRQKTTASIPVTAPTDGKLQDVYLLFTPVQGSRGLIKTIRFTPQ